MPDRPNLLARLTLVPTLDDSADERLAAGSAADTSLHAAHIHPEKFRIPGSAASHLQRAHLLDRMDNPDPARLILIEAAAGFGKTTLLRQYRERCLAQGRQVLWLTLDGADNDLRRLAAHLHIALQALDGDQKSSDLSPQALLDKLAERAPPFAIFLDDFETLESAQALDFVQRLLKALPNGGLLVIASRTTPDIALGRLRAHGQMLDIGTDALRMSLGETTTFIREKCGLALEDAEIAALQQRTEGWITALYLSTLSLRGRKAPRDFVASLSGANLELTDYLAEDILERQTEECRQFLLCSSVLERFSAMLCDAVFARGDSQAMIDYLQRANLFIQATDEHLQWFRYHPLFADFLRRALERQHPGQAEKLHAAAARWYLDNHQPVAAIEHCLLAGDTQGASQQIDRHLDPLIDAGRLRLLLRWFEQIPARQLDAYPRLVLAHAWTLVLDRRYQDAMQRIEHHRASPQTDTIRCLLQVFTDQIDAAYTTGLAQIERISPQDILQYGMLATTLAYCMVATGRHEQARSLLTQMVSQGAQNRSVIVDTIVVCVESILDLIQGRLQRAGARLDAASVAQVQSPEGKWSGGRPSLDILRALTYYEKDQLPQARQLLVDIPPHALDSGGPDPMIVRHILLARIAWQQGQHDTWVQQLAELEQLGRRSGSVRMHCAAWLERARVATLENRPDIAAQALHNADLAGHWDRPDLLLYSCDSDTPFIARQRLRILKGEHDSAAAALQPAITQALERQQHRRALKLRLLYALALEGLGRHKEALDTLTKALLLASDEGFIRTIVDEGPALAKLLQRWAVSFQAQCKNLGIDPVFLSDLLQRASTWGALPEAEVDDLESRLTTREFHVIRLLAAGNRNRAIAEQMHLSEHTVKTHLRNVSAKLGARSRTEVVAIARAKGLLD
ncbi:LuxR C-terminal-related transcriptional regulator [Pseudomonas sp. WJP1]|uniref:LuxR C-terminal-related transcriptional regulator n=1 Tax=Pseudomonas sp. WJP1 TaxID=2986947 RepID=UPI00234B38F7|nr:LuxR C-terminal-related transcriptional regulator [Pseudomonas sp. WJP1]WCM54056.1 LuxR C-terminal-related transcriptional regulator [Pseudomonas sp. WJP1]